MDTKNGLKWPTLEVGPHSGPYLLVYRKEEEKLRLHQIDYLENIPIININLFYKCINF